MGLLEFAVEEIMAFGARGSARDFGLSSGLALPVNARREHNATSEQVMPQEKTGRRKGFAVEHEGVSFSFLFSVLTMLDVLLFI